MSTARVPGAPWSPASGFGGGTESKRLFRVRAGHMSKPLSAPRPHGCKSSHSVGRQRPAGHLVSFEAAGGSVNLSFWPTCHSACKPRGWGLGGSCSACGTDAWDHISLPPWTPPGGGSPRPVLHGLRAGPLAQDLPAGPSPVLLTPHHISSSHQRDFLSLSLCVSVSLSHTQTHNPVLL